MILAEAKGIVLSISVQDVWIYVDKNKIKEVILNLISNAFKIYFNWRVPFLFAATHWKGAWIMSVEDTGFWYSSGRSGPYI